MSWMSAGKGNGMRENLDQHVVTGFGKQWEEFDQNEHSHADLQEIFNGYFNIFPWHLLPAKAIGFDLGCGTGRWAKFVAERVGTLHCIDASEAALNVAR